MAVSRSDLLIRLTAENKAGQAFAQMQQQLKGLQDTVRNVALAIGSALALRESITAAREYGKALDNLTDTLGISGEAASRWNYQARVVGIGADELTQSFGILSTKIFESSDEILKGTSVFDKFGIKVLDANNVLLSNEQILGNVREAMTTMGAQSQIAFERSIFGKSGGKLHDFLALTSADIAEMNAEMTALGMEMSGGSIRAMEQQERELNKMGIAFDQIKIVVGRALIPVFIALVPIIRQAAGAVKSLAEALKAPLGILKDVIQRFAQFGEDIRKMGFGEALAKLATDIIAKAKEWLPKMGEELDKLGPLGWAIKIEIASAIFAFASGVVGTLFGGLLTAAKAAFGLAGLLTPAGVGGLPLALALSAGVLIGLAAYKIVVDWDSGSLYDVLLTRVSGGLMAAGVVLAAAGIVAGGGIPIAIGLGILLGVSAYELLPDKWRTGLTGAATDIVGMIGSVIPGMRALGDVLHFAAETIIEWAITGHVPTVLDPGNVLAGIIKRLAELIPGMSLLEGIFHFSVGAVIDWVISGGKTTGTAPPPITSGGHRDRETIPIVPGSDAAISQSYERWLGRSAGSDEVAAWQARGFTPDQIEAGIRDSIEAAAYRAGNPIGRQPFAHGGIVTRPTNALIGEAGPEAVIPLGRGGMGNIINVYVSGNVTRNETELANMVADRIMRAGASIGQMRYR